MENDFYAQAYQEASKENPHFEKAHKLLLQAINKEDSRAIYALATWYFYGQSPVVRKNIKKGVSLWQLAAKYGNSDALYDLAVCYEKGIGRHLSKKKAFEYYTRAALAGDKQAHQEIGRMYYYGIGVKRDRRLASAWLDKAKELGIDED